MTEKYKDLILPLISKNGPMGVNAIARETNIPLSTIQKYMHSQNYFRINERRRWDLPENVESVVKNNTLDLMVSVLENSILLIQSQLEETQLAVQNSLTPIKTLQRGIRNISPSVAEPSHKDLNPRITALIELTDNVTKAVKAHKANITEEQYKMLLNTKWLDMVLDNGANYMKDVVESSLYDLLLGEQAELSEDALSTVKEYQKDKEDKEEN